MSIHGKNVKPHSGGEAGGAEDAKRQASANKKVVSSLVKKGSIYKRQLLEKQKVKQLYGVSEEQFKRFFSVASKAKVGSAGENLMCLLERRMDNVLYRLKLATTRALARQMIVHGHIKLNGKKIKSPALLVNEGDVVTFYDSSLSMDGFVKHAIDKRLNIGVAVPNWLELKKNEKTGIISRLPKRSDIQVQAEEHLIVELYSK